MKVKISQRKAMEYQRALAALKQAVENEHRTWPYSMNVRDALDGAKRVLQTKVRS